MHPILPLANPRHQIVRPPPLKVQRVALEQVRDERRVPVGRELVREELAIAVDAVDVRDVEKGGVFAGCVCGGGCEVGFDVVVDCDVLASGFASD